MRRVNTLRVKTPRRRYASRAGAFAPDGTARGPSPLDGDHGRAGGH